MDKDNPNLKYCLQFLRNGGERIRAIRLCMDATGIGAVASVKFVDELNQKYLLIERDKPQRYCPDCNNYLDPKTPNECPICGGKNVTNYKPGNFEL